MEYEQYAYTDSGGGHVVAYLHRPVFDLAGSVGPGTRVLDVGCGNGFWAGQFLERGCTVVGIDLSESGIEIARRTHPKARFELLPADKNVLQRLGEAPFDLVVSTEVVEHLYDPRAYAAGCFAALRSGGQLVCSTPYHGYAKNLLISLAGRWDTHANPLWDCGHIKLWSRRTLSQLLTEAGFTELGFRGAGRLPWLWMSMVMSARKP